MNRPLYIPIFAALGVLGVAFLLVGIVFVANSQGSRGSLIYEPAIEETASALIASAVLPTAVAVLDGHSHQGVGIPVNVRATAVVVVNAAVRPTALVVAETEVAEHAAITGVGVNVMQTAVAVVDAAVEPTATAVVVAALGTAVTGNEHGIELEYESGKLNAGVPSLPPSWYVVSRDAVGSTANNSDGVCTGLAWASTNFTSATTAIRVVDSFVTQSALFAASTRGQCVAVAMPQSRGAVTAIYSGRSADESAWDFPRDILSGGTVTISSVVHNIFIFPNSASMFASTLPVFIRVGFD